MKIIWCMVPEIPSITDVIFCYFGPFLPFYLSNNLKKSKFWKNEKKKTSWDILMLHMCTINDNHVMYGSWDIWKIKILKKWKKHLDVLLFYTCVPKMTIIWCMVPKTLSMTDRIFCHFGPFFALLPFKQPKKSKFWKNKKRTWRY